MRNSLKWLRGTGVAAGLAAFAAATVWQFTPAQAQEPIKIGFSMALTGPLAANGKQALLGMKIWEEEINARTRPCQPRPPCRSPSRRTS
jgi:branched-chain amino acid transport system substrate-binding protein